VLNVEALCLCVRRSRWYSLTRPLADFDTPTSFRRETVHALAFARSIQSMLASCKKKERPQGNDRYVKNAPISPKMTLWDYHDDEV